MIAFGITCVNNCASQSRNAVADRHHSSSWVRDFISGIPSESILMPTPFEEELIEILIFFPEECFTAFAVSSCMILYRCVDISGSISFSISILRLISLSVPFRKRSTYLSTMSANGVPAHDGRSEVMTDTPDVFPRALQLLDHLLLLLRFLGKLGEHLNSEEVIAYPVMKLFRKPAAFVFKPLHIFVGGLGLGLSFKPAPQPRLQSQEEPRRRPL